MCKSPLSHPKCYYQLKRYTSRIFLVADILVDTHTVYFTDASSRVYLHKVMEESVSISTTTIESDSVENPSTRNKIPFQAIKNFLRSGEFLITMWATKAKKPLSDDMRHTSGLMHKVRHCII